MEIHYKGGSSNKSWSYFILCHRFTWLRQLMILQYAEIPCGECVRRLAFCVKNVVHQGVSSKIPDGNFPHENYLVPLTYP